MKKKSDKPEDQLVSIIMLTHNAPAFIKHSIETLAYTEGKYELIVVDNNSDTKTRKLLLKLFDNKKINKLLLLDQNLLFAKGNNAGSKLCSPDSKYILLLNSDVEIRNKHWLKLMLKNHKEGITTLGFCEGNPYNRGDGYCFLIDRKLYEKHQLDEAYEWFWSITKIQAKVLKDGHHVAAVKNHENLLYHFGGASGGDWQGASGMDANVKEIIKWFSGKQVEAIDELEADVRGLLPTHRSRSIKKKLRINK